MLPFICITITWANKKEGWVSVQSCWTVNQRESATGDFLVRGGLLAGWIMAATKTTDRQVSGLRMADWLTGYLFIWVWDQKYPYQKWILWLSYFWWGIQESSQKVGKQAGRQRLWDYLNERQKKVDQRVVEWFGCFSCKDKTDGRARQQARRQQAGREQEEEKGVRQKSKGVWKDWVHDIKIKREDKREWWVSEKTCLSALTDRLTDRSADRTHRQWMTEESSKQVRMISLVCEEKDTGKKC